MRRIFYLAVVLVALSACGGGGGDGGISGLSPGISITTIATAPPPACTDLAGTPVDDLVENALCTNPAGGQELLVFFGYGCPDGRRLMWNDYGWGYTGGVWQAHARADGQLVPPDTDMAACPDP